MGYDISATTVGSLPALALPKSYPLVHFTLPLDEALLEPHLDCLPFFANLFGVPILISLAITCLGGVT